MVKMAGYVLYEWPEYGTMVRVYTRDEELVHVSFAPGELGVEIVREVEHPDGRVCELR